MHLTEAELASRVPVWYALSELFTGRELQDYDYRWMTQVLNESGLSREEIFVILDEEVAPALQANLLYNPTPVMDDWTEEDVKQLVTEYVTRKPTKVLLAFLCPEYAIAPACFKYRCVVRVMEKQPPLPGTQLIVKSVKRR